MESIEQKKDMQLLIGTALRVGVMTACAIALASGIYYLICHGIAADSYSIIVLSKN